MERFGWGSAMSWAFLDELILSFQTLYSFLYSVHSKETTILNEFGLLKKSLETIKLGKKTPNKSATMDLADNDMTTLWQNFAVSNQKEHANWVAALNLLIQDIRKLRDEIKKRLKVTNNASRVALTRFSAPSVFCHPRLLSNTDVYTRHKWMGQ